MDTAVRKVKGQCRCGQVKFEVTSEPLITMACHCVGCQKMTASAFSLSALFPSATFAVTSGVPVIGGMHGNTRHYFCGYCMSWLFTRPEGLDDFVNVRSTMLDHPQNYKPFMETYTDEKLEWATTGAKRSFKKLPLPEEYPALIQEYVNK
ncbi:GFA family protein [Picosynechococcus sp. PCC 8807]|uniref:GFA family protein n=1 Tax=Picosynechococcus sp. PCC 8807 TaxID=195248 RepID=UPI00081063EA|nr:GFA family protein [Picosynechococcus sp. PCC 8807]ANV92181.1 aldehyde-activating protein [Picosynechococcus sp. PCC 8807]